jgi:acyl-coenzyme A synthetase/AMP-(fatty) acid ligase
LPAEIRRHLIRHLPGHAIPRKIKTAEKIPVSAAGKYDNTAICDILDS